MKSKKVCKKCEGKGERNTRPFWIIAQFPCEHCNATGFHVPKSKRNDVEMWKNFNSPTPKFI